MLQWIPAFRRSARVEAIDHPLAEQVRELMRDVQAYARSHGGSIELIRISTENNLHVRLKGACAFCPLSTVTLRIGVEQKIRMALPEINKVIVDR